MADHTEALRILREQRAKRVKERDQARAEYDRQTRMLEAFATDERAATAAVDALDESITRLEAEHDVA